MYLILIEMCCGKHETNTMKTSDVTKVVIPFLSGSYYICLRICG